jgi:hypothetical protein
MIAGSERTGNPVHAHPEHHGGNDHVDTRRPAHERQGFAVSAVCAAMVGLTMIAASGRLVRGTFSLPRFRIVSDTGTVGSTRIKVEPM